MTTSRAEGAAHLVAQAVEEFGVDILVNNGFLRDKMLVSMSENDFDDVIRVHLKGHFAMLRHAAAYWREQSKAGAQRGGHRIVNTSSGAGPVRLGGTGQLRRGEGRDRADDHSGRRRTLAWLRDHGQRDRAVGPHPYDQLRWRSDGCPRMALKTDGSFGTMDPANVSPLVVWAWPAGIARRHRRVRGGGRHGVGHRRLATQCAA